MTAVGAAAVVILIIGLVPSYCQPKRKNCYRRETTLGSNLLKFGLRLEAEWLPSYSQAGTFLFIRPAFAPSSAAVPISVVDVSGNEVCLVVKCVGPKTSLLLAADDRVVIRGPYFSGLTDTQILRTTRNEEAVLVAGGMGQSAIVMAAKLCYAVGIRLRFAWPWFG